MKKLVLTNLILGVPTEIRTQISRFKVLRANRYTIGTYFVSGIKTCLVQFCT